MEFKKALSSSHRIRLSLCLGLFVVYSSFSSPVLAEESFCDAVQSSHKELPRLDASCPIGKGVWGKKVPTKGSEFYWIQCGLLPKPLSLAKAKPLYSKITTDIWMKSEPDGYRCLIGPYFDLNNAADDLREVKTLSSYKEAFIRVVGESNSKLAKPSATQAKPVVKPKLATPVSSAHLDADVFESPAKKVQPKPAVNQAKPKPATKSQSQPLLTGNDDITVRLTTSLQGKTYVVPYLAENRNQFYMEHGTPWNRLNYQDASQLCQQLGMSLVTQEEFNRLRDSEVMEKERWPLQLPYWGKGKLSLFSDRTANKLTGGSLLNVLCVK